MIGKDVSDYFANYIKNLQAIPCLLQQHISSALHMDTVQDRYMRQLEAVTVKTEQICGSEKLISEMMSLLLALNELYDGKISEINTLEEDLEKISELMLSSKAAVFADDAQHLCSLTSAFQSGDWQSRKNFITSRKKSGEVFSPVGRIGVCSDPRRTGAFKGASNTKERFAQRLKQHRFRRASSDILLRGTKWINVGKRRHRIADGINNGSGTQRSLQTVPSTSKNLKMRGMRAGVKCSSSGPRPAVGDANNIGAGTGNQPCYLMSPRGGRSRGTSACSSPPILSASRTGPSSKSRILEQNSRSALPSSRHIISHGTGSGGSSHKLAGEARKRTRTTSVNPEDSRRQVVDTNLCDADSASDQSEYDSNSDGVSAARGTKIFDLHNRTQHVFGEASKEELANSRFNEEVLPSGEGATTDHDEDLTSNDSTLSNDAYTVNESRSGSRVPSPASKQQTVTPSTPISSTGGGKNRTSSPAYYRYRSSLRRSANSPDLLASKSSETPRSQSASYHLSKRGRSSGQLRNHSATRSPAPQSPAATVAGFSGTKSIDQVNANENDDTEDDDNNAEEGTTGTGERVYCLCKKVSFGEMIACDNKRCPIEWFHFGCVDIRVQPKGKWYCPQCRGETSKCRRGDA
uniref:Meckel syndrome type 1 protein homolog n=1 Tax=Schistocephalus solidus TaxID=70667 RepID=A0A0X3NRQ9_SCHSO